VSRTAAAKDASACPWFIEGRWVLLEPQLPSVAWPGELEELVRGRLELELLVSVAAGLGR